MAGDSSIEVLVVVVIATKGSKGSSKNFPIGTSTMSLWIMGAYLKLNLKKKWKKQLMHTKVQMKLCKLSTRPSDNDLSE